MRVTITGATGFIGKALVARLATEGHQLSVLARKRPASLPAASSFHAWDAINDEFPLEALDGAQAVIHLAGEPVGQRWTVGVKRRIRESREQGTRRLVEALSTMSLRPEVLISASAIGYYGNRGDEELTEDSRPGSDFLARTCIEWEKAARLAESLGMRVVTARLGIVLSRDGGALAQMLPPFRAGAGGRIGSGQQWMSWIHLSDLIDLLRLALTETSLRGAVNLTAPNPARNVTFSRELGRALHRPSFLPVPGFALKLLFGEMAGVLLGGQRVIPKQALARGFRFRFPDLSPALADLLS